MAKRSTVKTLPKAVKEWLDAALIEQDFSGYQTLEAELRASFGAPFVGNPNQHRSRQGDLAKSQ